MKVKIFICAVLLLLISTFSFGQKRLSKGDHFAEINGNKIHNYVRGKGPVCLFPSSGWGTSVAGYMKSLKQFEKYFTMV